MAPPPLGVASDETGQRNVALSGATEDSALSEDGKEGASLFHHTFQIFA